MDKKPLDFNGLGIDPKLFEVLKKLNFVSPTPIQHQAIPVAIQGKDVIGIAQTGTGKTLAFGIPLLQRIIKDKQKGLAILPTRELALQVEESLSKVGASLGIRTAVLIGGENMGRQVAALKRNPHIIIATPGRLMDHLRRRTARLDEVGMVILDEADRMLDMGFAPQIEMILGMIKKPRQVMLFSATMPTEIIDLATRHMEMPLRIEVAPAGTAAEQVEQEIFVVRKDGKMDLLEKMLGETDGPVLVFSRTKYGARDIRSELASMGYGAAEIHSDRSQFQRKRALDGFKAGKYKVLVATDIAARGIDVKEIALVVNFDLPDNSEDYVHRIGRTGRAGKMGKAVSFATPEQAREIQDIERLIKKEIPRTELAELKKARFGSSKKWGGKKPFAPRKSGGWNKSGAENKSGFGRKNWTDDKRRDNRDPKGGFKKRGFAKRKITQAEAGFRKSF